MSSIRSPPLATSLARYMSGREEYMALRLSSRSLTAWSDESTTVTVVPRTREYTGLLFCTSVSWLILRSSDPRCLGFLPILLCPFFELMVRVRLGNLVYVSDQWERRRTWGEVLGPPTHVPQSEHREGENRKHDEEGIRHFLCSFRGSET